jgi:Ankyrin repeats (many copies)
MKKKTCSVCCRNLSKIINTKSDGGVTALHMAALNAHVECVQLLLDLGASVSEVTVDDGTTIDLIGTSFLQKFLCQNKHKVMFFFSFLFLLVPACKG